MNNDDPNAAYFKAACPVDILTYGIEQPADVRAHDVRLWLDRTVFAVVSPIGTRRIETGLLGYFADLAIVTSDDPYSEQPESIIDGIVAGARAAGGMPGQHFLVVPDRRQAIRRAVELAQPDDLVLIAGRGHLRYRVAGNQRAPFDDAQVARQMLHSRWPSAA